ncbi:MULTISPECIES: CopG family transcriptional regulator [unclassified Luteococcus]|uniref:CopG family transcriptional regulator n=1 Tax=unclassified Luteococcus TaxID=2639923 RepID=UPI00313E698A
MRTTVNLEAEAERLVADLRREKQLGLSEAVNELIRRGAASHRTDYVFPEMTFEMGAKIPLESTSALLELLDEVDA